jgi:hypothetical protein
MGMLAARADPVIRRKLMRRQMKHLETKIGAR